MHLFCKFVPLISHRSLARLPRWLSRRSIKRFYCAVQPLTSHSSSEKLSYYHGLPDKPFIGATIGQLIDESAEKYSDREAYVFCQSRKRATFAELKTKVEKLASGFLALGLKKGDRVGIWGPNSEEWILTQFATAKAGLILVNINPAYQVAEAHFALKKVGCKAIIASSAHKTQDYYRMLCEIAPELPDSKPGWLHSDNVPDLQQVIITGDKNFSGTWSFNHVMQAGGHTEMEELIRLQQHLQFDDAINIQFTSGTTGNPKGATLSHHNIVNNAYLAGSIVKYDQRLTKICVPVPLYHCFGMVLGSLASVVFGATIVYPSPSFDARASLMAVQNEKCSSLYGTPTMFIDMLNHKDFDQFDLSSLRTGILAGSTCHTEIMNAVIQKMHMPEVTIGYGLTELSPISNQTQIDDPIDIRVSTVGRMHPNNEGKIVNSHGEIVPIGEDGELCVRGYNVMLGYWDDEEKTKSTVDSSGWLYTGDIASMDENGYVKLIGRIKDVIIRGGENIYPTEIEQFLHHHPKIQEVEVIGLPDKRMGEEVCAWIRPEWLKWSREDVSQHRHACLEVKFGFIRSQASLYEGSVPVIFSSMVGTYFILCRVYSFQSPLEIAILKLTSGETATVEEIKEFCKGKISHFKIPRYIKFVDEMPMTVTGKVKKYVMREISAKEYGLE